jgi:hypothetical protein
MIRQGIQAIEYFNSIYQIKLNIYLKFIKF